jgi:NADH dehydrogenase
MADLVRFAARKANKPGWIVPLPAAIGYLQALAFEYGPGPTLMSRDNIASMSLPNVLPNQGRDALTLDFGLARKRLESMLA